MEVGSESRLPWRPVALAVLLLGRSRTELLCTRNSPEVAIEGPEWKVSGLPCDFDEQAVREPEPRPLKELVQGGSHDLVILNGQDSDG